MNKFLVSSIDNEGIVTHREIEAKNKILAIILYGQIELYTNIQDALATSMSTHVLSVDELKVLHDDMLRHANE